jgi:hypothetical protein
VVHDYQYFVGILCIHVEVRRRHILDPELRTSDYPKSFIKFTTTNDIIFKKSVLLNLQNVTHSNEVDTSGEITFGNSDVL